jgi:hypothetical protein
MHRRLAAAIVGLGVCATGLPAVSFAGDSVRDAGDDATVGSSRAATFLRFTEWTMVHTMGSEKGTDPSVVLKVEDQSEMRMMLMSCADRPYGSYTHICSMFQRCAELPKERWATTIGEPPPGTLLVAACGYPLHFFVVRQDGGKLVALRRKMRRGPPPVADAGALDGGAPAFRDPFCPTCVAAPVEDWQTSRSLPLPPNVTLTTGLTERRQAKWDLD